MERERAFIPRLRPGERFSHVSAARIWGMPLPLDADARIHIAASGGRNRRRRDGVRGYRIAGAATMRDGFRVSTVSQTFVELGTQRRPEDLVAVGDWIVTTPRIRAAGDIRPFSDPAGLRAAAARSNAWGCVAARRAAALVRAGAESPQETRLRLLLVGAGFAEPQLGVAVADANGAHIGYFDLVWPDRGVIVEYDGDQHRTDSRQYEKDILRYDRATAAGWRVVRVRRFGLSPDGISDTLVRVAQAFGRI